LGAMDENRGSNRARELRLESFAKDKVLKPNLELPLNATEQDTFAPVLLRESLSGLSLTLFQSSSYTLSCGLRISDYKTRILLLNLNCPTAEIVIIIINPS
jgi:hypothetical protein